MHSPGAETPTDPLEPTSGCTSSSAGGGEACESPALGTEQSAASCGTSISAHARSPAEGNGEAGGGGSGARDPEQATFAPGLPQHAPLPPQPPAMQLFSSLSVDLYHSSGSARFPTRLWGGEEED
eukprot:6919998-Prymnesium_polylepis.1